MRFDVRAAAITGAIIGGTAYVIGAIFDLLSSWGGYAFVSFIMRLELVEASRPMEVLAYGLGFITFVLTGAFLGGLAAAIYNRLARTPN